MGESCSRDTFFCDYELVRFGFHANQSLASFWAAVV